MVSLEVGADFGFMVSFEGGADFGFMVGFEVVADFGFMVSFEGGADFGIYGLAGVEGCLDLWFNLRSCLELAVFS